MTDTPENTPAEIALLSAVLLDPRHYKRLRSRVDPEVFAHNLCREAAKSFKRIDESGLDVTMLTLIDDIRRDDKRRDLFERTDDGIRFLGELTSAGVPSTSVDSYLKLVEEAAAKRDILRANEEMAAMARNGTGSGDLAQMFHAYARRMERVLQTAQEVRTVSVTAALDSDVVAVPWIAEGWLGVGDVVIFGGEWASGKSLIALDLAISIAAEIPWMGRVPILKSGGVLYIDEENNAQNISRRVARMVRGRGLEDDKAKVMPLRYLTKNHLRLDTLAGRSALEREIETHRPVLVVLDSLIRFHGGDENSNTDIAALFAEAIVPLATKYGCAFVILDHMRKPGKEDDQHDVGHRIRGAGDKAGVGDGVWTVQGDRKTDSRTFSCSKNRWEDSLPPAMTTRWVVSDDDTAAYLECHNAEIGKEVSRIAAEVAIPRILLNFPAGLLASELYDRLIATGTTKRTGQRVVRALVERGEIFSRKEPYRKVRYWVNELEMGSDR